MLQAQLGVSIATIRSPVSTAFESLPAIIGQFIEQAFEAHGEKYIYPHDQAFESVKKKCA